MLLILSKIIQNRLISIWPPRGLYESYCIGTVRAVVGICGRSNLCLPLPLAQWNFKFEAKVNLGLAQFYSCIGGRVGGGGRWLAERENRAEDSRRHRATQTRHGQKHTRTTTNPDFFSKITNTQSEIEIQRF